MNTGNIVEYIDQQKIICAVVTEIKKQRLRLLTETNREVNLSASRIIHTSAEILNLSAGRDNLVRTLKETAARRSALMAAIDLKELWELLNEENEWIDLVTMTEFCFSNAVTSDHESAVIRSFFENRVYFKFNNNSFFPNSPEQVEQTLIQQEEAARRNRLIEKGGSWLKKAVNDSTPAMTDDIREFVKILSSYYIFEKESRHAAIGKALLARAGVDLGDKIFDLMVRLGVWDEHENIDLHRNEITETFSEETETSAEELIRHPHKFSTDARRRDLTDLPLMTIDGQSTRDYDDALSIQKSGDDYIVGVHIIDVGHFIKKGSVIDRVAMDRGSSIYMPDNKIPMLPTPLSEGLCSLKEGELRPAISILFRVNRFYEIIDHEIAASTIRVRHRLSYTEANKLVDTDENIGRLYAISRALRRKRLDAGAIQINLPEINIWLDENGDIVIHRIDRESPSRILVSEMMIMANALMAEFLSRHEAPAAFRSQPDPKARLYKGEEGTLFQNCMQRRQFSRAILGHQPEHHSGLGLNAYVTATSPIRRYFDLATQRQIRAVLGFESPYSADEFKKMFQLLEYPMSCVGRIQYMRRRYWLLKYLERKTGTREEALVLEKRRDYYTVLLKEFMLECRLSQSSGVNLKPEDLIQVVIQHVNARKDDFSVFMG